MKNLSRGLALAVIGAGLAAVPFAAVPASAAPSTPDGRAAMSAAAEGKVDFATNPATGRVAFARARAGGDLMSAQQAQGRSGAITKSRTYLDRFAGNFGARAGELRQSEVFADDTGWTVTYTQTFQGVPVFGAEIKAHVDRDGDLTSVNGYAAPGLNLSVTPRVTKAEASKRALGAVKAKPAGYEDGLPAAAKRGLEVRSADLTVYRMGSTRGITGEAKLAWAVEVWNKSTIREFLILDAATGKPLNRWSMMAHALDRELYEAYRDDNGTPDNPDDDFVGGLDTPVWSEGDAFPGQLDEDQQNEVLATGESYWMFKNTFGYDSWDGAGTTMITVNNDPRIACPNANWNGVTTNYCSGVTGDDTVAHEWGHAYTESTSGLIYQWQAGAMNEAYSDIWGETVDMLNSRHNEGGETEAAPVYRTPGACSVDQPAPYDLTVSITAPAEIAGECNAATGFGPDLPNGEITAEVIVATDDAASGSTTDGCTPFTNAAAIANKWAYVDRGACSFQDKADNATAAGAQGLIVGNNTGTAPPGMAGDGTIYTLGVSMADGTRIKSVDGPTTMSILRDESRYTDDTYRWLSGESDPAFGGAIRDLWNPNCYGDPGKVSDAEYHCGADDSGGVHTNSGVVNRAFAMLVDGMDGQGTGIGLDKAANLFWHTQVNYLTPTSYFPDLANGLEASCQQLTGVDINKVTLGNPSEADGSDGAAVPETISGGLTAADCGKLADVIADVELRMDPTEQCEWVPLLAPGAPGLDCGTGTEESVSYSEDFEDGLDGWTQDEELGFDFSEGIAWEPSTAAPGGHAGGVAFGPDPVAGVCGDVGDLTSRNGLISPAITVPSGTSARMQFDHYVATEATWDGGNVKIAVNGGDFELVPASAFLHNAPAGTMDPDSGPMGGQPAWTGSDGGEMTGSWGTTVIDLAAAGANAGDSIQVRFDMARDGCNGLDGWYVDNVKVSSCTDVVADVATKTTAVHVPEPSTYGTTSKVEVTVARDGSSGAAPTGVVELVDSTGAKVATGTLANGKATLVLPATLPVGAHAMTAKYLGGNGFAASQVALTVTVTAPGEEITSTTKVKITPKAPKAHKKFKIKVKVKASDGSKLTEGTVVVRIDGKVVGKGTVKNGKLTITLKKGLKAGKHKLVAKYKGTSTVQGSKATMRFKVRR